eukprot:TRINITY_DN15111_c0_g2_i1.p1 TRINITY_DN15111_c0_g2~~TRINITY_DN15111_c0_g2_i1.p1  ORF type:complete len:339 (-),score=125.48 TRINITY_DN15111_c0_g2_i1:471-1487(-)
MLRSLVGSEMCIRDRVSATRELAPVSDLNVAWHGQKPLHLAVVANNADVVKVLLEGAQQQGKASFESFINECDEYELAEVGDHIKHTNGQTALHWCVGLGESHQAMMKMLLTYGANATAKDRNSETPIMRAIEFGNTAAFELLTESAIVRDEEGNPVYEEIKEPAADDVLASLEANLADAPKKQPTIQHTLRLDICDKQGRSSLHYAILGNRVEMAMKLLEMGHEVALEDQDKVTPIVLAMYAAMPTVLAKALERADQFQVLSTPFHNGVAVLPDRVEWMSFVAESDPNRAEVAKVFQKKLEAINKANAPPATADDKKKRKKKDETITLAPSAPVRKR